MINRTQIIEEASKKAQEIVNKHSFNATDILSKVPFFPVQAPATIVNGYQAGEHAGHPVVGAMLGRNAAIGAMSKHDKNVSIGDVYTKKNVASKATQGAIGGAVLGGMLGGPAGAAIGATANGIAAGAIAPAAGYGLGKVFGSTKSPKK